MQQQQLFFFNFNLLLVLVFSSILSSVIFCTTICCKSKKKKNKTSTTSLKSEIHMMPSAMTQMSGKEMLSERANPPASTREKISGNTISSEKPIPVEKTNQKIPTPIDVHPLLPQGVKPKIKPQATTTKPLPSSQPLPAMTNKDPKMSKGGKGQQNNKIAEARKKLSERPSSQPNVNKPSGPNIKKPSTTKISTGKEVISLIPISPSTPTSVPTISSKATSAVSRGTSTSGSTTPPATTPAATTSPASAANSSEVPSSAIFDIEEDSSSVASIGKKRKSAVIRAQEDGPEEETTDPGSYHTLADLQSDKVFKRVG